MKLQGHVAADSGLREILMTPYHWREIHGYASGTVLARNVSDAYRVLEKLFGLKAGEVEVTNGNS